MASLKKNVAGQNFTFCMVSATTGGADTGATVSVKVTKDNGTQASGGGTVTNSGNGQYNYAPTQAETNATCVGFLLTASGDIPVNIDFHTDLVDSNGFLEVDVEDWKGATAPAMPANFASLSINGSGFVTVVTNNDKTGYSLTQAFPSNFATLAISVAGAVTVGTNNDKTGYSLTQAFPSNFALLSISGSGFVTLAQAFPTNFASQVIDSNGNVFITSNVKKSTASAGFQFVMTDSTTHQPKTGLTVSATKCIDGSGGFVATTNAPTEVANGTYTINLSAADLSGNHIQLRFTATGADDLNIEIITQP